MEFVNNLFYANFYSLLCIDFVHDFMVKMGQNRLSTMILCHFHAHDVSRPTFDLSCKETQCLEIIDDDEDNGSHYHTKHF